MSQPFISTKNLKKFAELCNANRPIYFTLAFALAFYVIKFTSLPSLTILFSILFHIPHLFEDMSKHHHIYFIAVECLILTALVTSGLDFSECLFYYFIQQDALTLLREKSPIIVFILSLEFVSILFSEHLNNIALGLVGVCFLGQLSIYVVMPSFYENSKFPSKTMIFGMIIDLMCGVRVKSFIFIVSIVLYPVSNYTYASVYKFTKENLFSFTYLIISFILNIYGIYSGLKIGSGALIGSAELSLYNTISLTIVLFGEVMSREPASPEYSYGKYRIQYIFQFTSVVVILFSAFRLLATNASSCFLDIIYVRNPLKVVMLSLIDFGISIFGVVTLGSGSTTSFSLLCDIFISSSALISALFDYIFNLPAFDLFISYLIVGTIFATTISELRDAIQPLNLVSPRTFVSKTLSKFGLRARNTIIHFWNLGSKKDILVISTHVDEKKLPQTRQTITEYFERKGVDATIEFI